MSHDPIPAPAEAPALLDVEALAALCGCSTRHIYRLADAGQMPRPVRLGALVRWPRQTVEVWIAQGCPSTRQSARAGVR